MRVVGQRHAPADLPPGVTQYPLYRRLGGPQGRSGRVLKISLPPGFDPRTVQLVTSRYTDWAIAAHTLDYMWQSFLCMKTSRYKSNGRNMCGQIVILFYCILYEIAILYCVYCVGLIVINTAEGSRPNRCAPRIFHWRRGWPWGYKQFMFDFKNYVIKIIS